MARRAGGSPTHPDTTLNLPAGHKDDGVCTPGGRLAFQSRGQAQDHADLAALGMGQQGAREAGTLKFPPVKPSSAWICQP